MIFCMSGTGNTLWAARTIAAATADTVTDISRVDTERHTFTAQKGENIGICFPVHGWMPSRLVRHFARTVRIERCGDNYVYILCSAGDTTGEALRILARDLKRNAIDVDAAFAIIMPESYMGLKMLHLDTPEGEQRKIAAAAERLKGFIDDIQCRRRGIKRDVYTRWPRINSRVLGPLFHRHLVKDTPFRVDKELCIGCGKCRAVCPVDDIEQTKGEPPRWKHNGRCLTCFACYHHCPVRAIDYGTSTVGRGQYYFGHADKRKNKNLQDKK